MMHNFFSDLITVETEKKVLCDQLLHIDYVCNLPSIFKSFYLVITSTHHVLQNAHRSFITVRRRHCAASNFGGMSKRPPVRAADLKETP